MNGGTKLDNTRNSYGNINTPHPYNTESYKIYTQQRPASVQRGFDNTKLVTLTDAKNFLLSKVIRTITDKNFNGDFGNFIQEFISDFVSYKINSNVIKQLTVNVSKTGYVFSNKHNQTIGLQTAYREHKQNAQFGDNIFQGKIIEVHLGKTE